MTLASALRTPRTLVAALLVAGCALDVGRAPESPRPMVDETARLLGRQARPAPPAAPRPRIDVASWYGEWHHGRPTASGEPYDMTALTAAHRSLPLGACVEVTHLGNGRRVNVRVNDRGPYIHGRTIDLSHRAAEDLGMVDDGLARVRIRRAASDLCGEWQGASAPVPAPSPLRGEGWGEGR
jgi:rare lipoprotein A